MSNNDTNQQPDPSDRHLNEILAELMRAVDAGQSVEPNEWLERYPDFAADINEYFEKQERMERLVLPLRRVAAHALHVRCPHCHNPIELLEDARLEEVSCPSCGSSFSLVGEKTVSHYSPGEKTIGHFQLLDRVGVGAFGSVWKARDTQLDRIVAVKIPRHSQLDELQTELFLRDARSAAQLKHPNIVSVHEVGKQDDTIYIVSDFIQGANLKEWTDAKRLTLREAAELCIKIAKALHHAHESGVIHRDMKPGNIMMDTGGEPHIVDFGLAKREAGEITMTVEGQILGTPAYMSPEQARGEGHTVDRRADIYSLGIILFELLTGEIPFRGDKQMLIVQIIADDPPSPRKLNSSVPRDLDTVCLKCLEKEPAKRYESGLNLAHDLERFLFGEPIMARPISRWERAGRWCHRHPQVASLIAVTMVLLATIAVVTSLGYFRESALRSDLQGEQQRASELQEGVQHLEQRRQKLDSDLAEGKRNLGSSERQLEQVNEGLHDSYLQLARKALGESNLELAGFYLDQCPENLRQQNWQQLKEQIRPIAVMFNGHRCVAISPDGSLIAGAGDQHTVLVWELLSGRLLHTLPHDNSVNAIAFSPDGMLLASGGGSQVLLWDPATGEMQRELDGHTEVVTDLDFSPDGKRLASASGLIKRVGGEVIVWDLNSFKSQTLSGKRFARFSHDGRHLATTREGRRDTVVLDLSLADDDASAIVLGISLYHTCRPAFHPNKDQIVVADPYGKVTVWDYSSKQIVQQFFSPVVPTRLQVSQDGRRLVCAGSSLGFNARYQAFIWNLVREETDQVLPWFSSEITNLFFSAGGDALATADRTEIKVWKVPPRHDPTEEILADIINMDVGRLDWPQWGGSPSRINTPSGKNIPLDWHTGRYAAWLTGNEKRKRNPNWRRLGGEIPENSRNVKWAVRLGSNSYGNPVVANGRVFIGTNNGVGYLKRYPSSIDLGVLLCFEENTGKFLWQHSNQKLPSGSVNDWSLQGVCSTPVVDGNRLWYVSNRGEVVCLDTEGFHDGEDDGPVKDEWTWLFDASIPALIKEEVEAAFAAHDVPWKIGRSVFVPNPTNNGWTIKSLKSSPGPPTWVRLFIQEEGTTFVVSRITEGDTSILGDEVLRFESRLLNALGTAQIVPFFKERLSALGVVLPDDVEAQLEQTGDVYSFAARLDGREHQFQLRRSQEKLRVEMRVSADDRDDADVVWRFDMMKELGVFQHNMAICSMITADGMLFVCTSNGHDQTHDHIPAPEAASFMAMDRRTGEVLWTDNSPGENILHSQWASPSYGVFDGQPEVIFPGGDGWVYSFDPKGDGQGGSKLLWKFDGNPKESKWVRGGRGTRNNIIAFPVIYDGLVYIVMGQDPEHGEDVGHLWCIDPAKLTDGGDVSAELAVDREGNVIPHRRTQAVNSSLGERAIPNPNSAVVWHYSQQDPDPNGKIRSRERFNRSMSIPVIKDDILYAADLSGFFHCMNAKTGEGYWTYDMLSGCWSSPLLVDGKVYIGNESGEVLVFRHSPNPRVAMKPVRRDGQIEFVPTGDRQYEILNHVEMIEAIYTTPIVANNVLYISTRTTLYAIEETNPLEGPR